jgi:hypothetical protein
VQNVDIECAFDIEVFDIECDARYRTSDTRYRGGKDPDVFERCPDSRVGCVGVKRVDPGLAKCLAADWPGDDRDA